MGIAQTPYPVKLMIAVMYRPDAPISEVMNTLTEHFGETDFQHGSVLFSWTDYYGPEMGTGLLKSYSSFGTPIDRTTLPSIKKCTNALEQQYAENGHRTINIDPGYVTRDKLVLASTKDFYHRIYLAEGIFAEVTLHYRKGGWKHFSWTYPDYREDECLRFLEKARAVLVRDCRKMVRPEEQAPSSIDGL